MVDSIKGFYEIACLSFILAVSPTRNVQNRGIFGKYNCDNDGFEKDTQYEMYTFKKTNKGNIQLTLYIMLRLHKIKFA